MEKPKKILEKVIERYCVELAKKSGVKVKKKIFGEQLDRWMFFPNGHLWVVEFKAPGKRLTPLQWEEIKELIKFNVDVEVHDNVEEFKEALDFRHQHKDVMRMLAASPVPERFHPLALSARRSGSIRRPRDGQNVYHFSRFKGS